MPDYDRGKFALNRAPCSIAVEDDAVVIKYVVKKELTGINDNKIPSTKTILISEILSVKCQKPEIEKESEKKKKVIFSPKKKLPALLIDTFKRCKDHKWKLFSLKLKSANEGLCEQWAGIIQEKLKAVQDRRPKSLLVFINPFGGRGAAEEVYEKKVKPVFDAVDIKTNVVMTKYRNHARTYIETKDISDYDGIIAVGGDGILNEVVNGLICRTQSQNGISVNTKKGTPRECPKFVRPNMRVGIIPAGSTDCVSYVTHGINDAETSALHIVVGDSHPIDVTSLHNSDGILKQFSLSLNGYGYYGDLLRKSESVRWMGPSRYSYVGVNAFLQLRSYSGEIHYLPGDSKECPQSSSFCRTPCSICQDGFEEEEAKLFTPLTPSKHFFTSVETSPASLSLQYKGCEKIEELQLPEPERNLTFSRSEVQIPSFEISDTVASCDTVAPGDTVTPPDTVAPCDIGAPCDTNATLTDVATGATLEDDVTPTNEIQALPARTLSEQSTTSTNILVTPTDDTPRENSRTEQITGFTSKNVLGDIYEGSDDVINFTAAVRPSSLCVMNHDEDEMSRREESSPQEKEWKVLRGDFIVVNGVTKSCACERSPLGLSPASHLADGELDLITVRACTRLQFLRYLISHTGSGDRFNFPFVEVRRVKAFQFIPSPRHTLANFDLYDDSESPLGSASPDTVQISFNEMSVKYSRSEKKKLKKSRESLKKATKRSQSMNDVPLSSWNSDGEVVDEANMTVRAHRGLILMFCRGIEDMD